MSDVYILDGNLNYLGIIDNYQSLIWTKRYFEDGECEVYVKASPQTLSLMRNGKYISRLDDDMVCEINVIELTTDVDEGDYIIVKGIDVKNLLARRVIWSQTNVNGKVEDLIRTLVTQSLSNPNLSARQIKDTNGRANFFLAAAKGFTEVTTEQVTYRQLSEKVQELCRKYGWGYRVYVQNNNFYFDLYKGTDRTNYVVFSNEYENIATTNYIEDNSNIGNVALVGGQGEGSARSRNVSGYAEGINRYEIYVDARDVSKTITWEELKKMYPTHDEGGQGSIQLVTSQGVSYYVYEMDYIDIAIVDSNQLTELTTTYPSGTQITIGGNLYYRVYSVAIADLPSNTLEDSDDVVLRDIVYSVYLLNRGYEKMAEYGATTTFEGSVIPNITFTYKQDYFLGDKVEVANNYGVNVDARIVEVIEVFDENGYSIEPKFEYLEEEE